MKMMNTDPNSYSGENRSLHMKERIGYGVGDFANNMMFAPVNSFFTYFLTNVAGLGAGVVGTMLLISRLLDGVSDLIVGTLMEKIHSKHGKARPWLLWWCVPFAVSLVLMFSAPDFGTTGKVVYAFLTYNLAVTIVYTAINLPFGSLAALMTKNQIERGYLNISKMVFAFGGGMVINAATLPLVKFFGNDSLAWQKTFLIYGAAAIILFLIVFFTTKEAVTETAEEKGTAEKINIKKALISLLKNKYWLQLLGIFFLNSMVNAFIGVNVYYAQYVMDDTSLVGTLSLFQNIASFASFACCTALIRKAGKQKIAVSGVVCSFIGYAMVLLNPTSYAVLYTSAVIKGVGNAALSGVIYGMLADTVEYNDWNSGIRAEGLVFSANSIGAKVGSGIGSALLGWILAAFGFVSSSAVQPESAINGIRVIFLYVPLVVFAVMFVILLFYKLDKEYDGIVKELGERK
ncbi:MFS transporter [Mediterraneibacter agrestimuris]|uniref:MFS transporter n=1 Tax=Mediterraneibacter agrestimuris TaxID=2941333 RepID=UPI0020404F68|nr:MFS transporter [Mediterraneibacter agrestimuris]